MRSELTSCCSVKAGEYYNIGGTFALNGGLLDFLVSQSSLKDELKIVEDASRLRPIDADLQSQIL